MKQLFIKPEKIMLVLEICLHLVLIVVIPFVFLELRTGFDKYLLPETMPIVYIYWLIYISVTVTFYGLKRRRKKYQPPDCTKKYKDL